jgi:thiamine-monophosphate kinase
MGAEAGEAYVVLGVPSGLGEAQCLELLDGLLELAARTGTTLAGGDVTQAPALSLAVTVVGHAPSAERLVRRAGAQPGDLLVLTGEIGGAAAGLALLEEPGLASALPAEIAQRLRLRQLQPMPRLAAGRALADQGARAMIDISDGLGADAGHLAAASGAQLRIDAATLPLAEGVLALADATGRDPLELAASGGEDYELLAAIPAERLEAAAAAVGELEKGTTLTPVGGVAAGAGVEIRLPGGALLKPAGFDQLRP